MTDKFKYCEVCGNKNSADATFCRICGNVLGSHGESADSIVSPEYDVNDQNIIPTTFSLSEFPPESTASSYNPAMNDVNLSPQWDSGGIGTALRTLLFKPTSSTATVALVSPTAPKISRLVYFNVLAVFVAAYIDAQHTTVYTNGVATSTEPVIMAVMKAALFLVGFYVGSYILGLIIKSSAIPGSTAQLTAQSAARKINAVRSMFFIVFNLVNALLIPTQPQYIYALASANNLDPNGLKIIQHRTAEYAQTLVVIQTITYVVSIFYLVIWLQKGLKLRNGMPLLLGLLTVVYLFIYKNPAILIA